MARWSFYFVTFGCKVNQYETQALREAWTEQGGEECASPALADVICVNSCAITARGERDARNAVSRLRREAPHSRIILTGCAARLFAAFRPRPGLRPAAPDLLVPQEDKASLLAGPWQPGETAATPLFPPFRISGYRRARPVLKVQDGCSHRCTYCIVPQTRGKPRSRPVADIVAEARRLLRAGHVELMVSGVNLSQYGRDAGTGDFWSLLATLDAALSPEFAGMARLRISSLEPGQLDERGLDILLACRLLCPHLHISLQHGSQPVLRRMGRGHYTPAMLEKAVRTLGAHWPVMGLGADFILGFPGEREEDVRELLALVERLPLSYAHVFPYSARPGTAAAAFADQVPRLCKMERAARVRAAVARKKAAFLRRQAALPVVWVALDRPQGGRDAPPGGCTGVNEFYAPCAVQGEDLPARGLVAAHPLRQSSGRLLVRPLLRETAG